MEIAGLYYFNPSSWSKIHKPLKMMCAEALEKITAQTLQECHEQRLDDALRKEKLVLALMGENRKGSALSLWVEEVLSRLGQAERRLSRIKLGGQRETSVYEAAVDLVLSLDKNWKLDGQAASKNLTVVAGHNQKQRVPSPALVRMADKLRKISHPATGGQFVTCAGQVLQEFRHHLTVDVLRTHHGVEVSVDLVDRKLLLIDRVQRELLHDLEKWQSFPELMGKIIGSPIHPSLPQPLSIRRALRDQCVCAAWLMRFDQHYVEIRVEMARQAGSPLSEKDRAKLKPPISSVRRDTLRFEEPVIAELLKMLCELRQTVMIGGDPGDVLTTLMQLNVVEDDAQTSVLPPPDLPSTEEDLFDSPEQEEEALAEASEDALANDSDADDETDAQADEDADAADADPPASIRMKDAPGSGSEAGAEATRDEESLCEDFLNHLDETVRVGVMLQLAKRVEDASRRKSYLDELVQFWEENGLFDRLGLKNPSVRALTAKVLAAYTPAIPGQASMSVGEFQQQVQAGVEALDKHTRELLKQNAENQAKTGSGS